MVWALLAGRRRRRKEQEREEREREKEEKGTGGEGESNKQSSSADVLDREKRRTFLSRIRPTKVARRKMEEDY